MIKRYKCKDPIWDKEYDKSTYLSNCAVMCDTEYEKDTFCGIVVKFSKNFVWVDITKPYVRKLNPKHYQITKIYIPPYPSAFQYGDQKLGKKFSIIKLECIEPAGA